ncbi:hypothetical protein F0252_19875 [Vibrio hepatarius]|nr:hypothetical protein [Vibrio hepatarius]
MISKPIKNRSLIAAVFCFFQRYLFRCLAWNAKCSSIKLEIKK